MAKPIPKDRPKNTVSPGWIVETSPTGVSGSASRTSGVAIPKIGVSGEQSSSLYGDGD